MEKHYVNLSENTKMAYQIYGEGSHTILLLHGIVGGSWLAEEWISAIQKSDVRCIVPERPGYGETSAIELQNVGDWIPIVQIFVQKLKISRADVIGCSAGAPYAYATALALPNIIKKVFILNGVPSVYESTVFRHYSKQDKETYLSFVNRPRSLVQEDYIQQMKKVEKQMKTTDLTYVKKTLQEVLAHHCYGMAQESRLQILPWGFPLSQIKQQIILYHAQSDEMVPYNAAKEMPGFLEKCEFHDVDTSKLPPGESVHRSSISESFYCILADY